MNKPKFSVRVIVMSDYRQIDHVSELRPRATIADYTMDHNDASQRRVLGEQVRSAFEAGQAVMTFPVPSNDTQRHNVTSGVNEVTQDVTAQRASA